MFGRNSGSIKSFFFKWKLSLPPDPLPQESVEQMVTRLAAEQELRKEISETVCPPPSARSSFSLCAHPERDELLLYGGEYYNGKNVSSTMANT